MSDSGPSRSTDWPTAGTSSSSVNVMYEQAEDEPSSSIPVSSSSDYGPTSSESFVSASYRSQPVFQANEQFQTDRYSIQGPSISGHIYQAAESSLPSRQDVSADQYGDIVAVGNEAQVQIYSNINNNENTYRVSHSQPASSSSVADGGYSVSHMIVDGMIVEAHDNPVTVGLQRVISPDVDSTVSQSVSCIPVTQRNVTDGEHSALSQTHRGNNGAVISMQVSQPQSEVSTSGETMSRLGQGHCHDNNDIEQENMETGRNQEVEAGPSGIMPQGEKRKYKYILTGSSNNIDVMESDVSSITESGSNEAEVNLARTSIKTDRRSLDDIVSGEPDTTQLDDDDNGDNDDGDEEYNQNGIDNSSNVENRHELSTDMLPIDTHPSSSNNIVDSTQMMTVALPVSNSIVSANQIAASNLSTNYIPVNISEYQEQIQAPPPAHLNLTTNEIALSQLTANQLAASIEPQLSQATYILDTSSIDSSSKLNPSDLGLQIVNFMSVKVDPSIDEPGTSAESTSSGNRRKSTRIATIDNGESTWKLPEYIPRPYNPNQLWCDECMQGYDTECEIHKLSLQPDKIVFSRAWASLPSGLQIFKLTQDDNALGVFTKRTLPKRTQFGPFIADMIPDDSSVTNPAFPLMVERQGTILYYDTTDENKCNWMMFVRPAQNYAEQNVVAYQYDGDIYFTVTKDITEPRTELKVWYAAHYAERWDKPCHKATDEDLKAIEESMCRFQCYECPKRFRTAAVLQKHLISHDSDPPKGSSTDEPSSSEAFTPPRRIRKSLMPKNILRQKLIANKKESGQYDSSGNMSGIFHWKKRSTNIYLNKTLKKYHKRHDAEMLRKSALSNQQMLMKNGENRSGEENSEWSCESCDLIFNNLTLLNLHMLFHSEDNTEEAKLTLQLEALLGTNCSADQVQFTCPGCGEHFFNKKDLIHHVSDHALPKSAEKLDYHSDIMNMSSSSNRQHRCSICMKTFTTIDRLAKHHQCHGDDSQKPFQCTVCFKRFMNNSALSCHMKTHSSAKYYQCPICHIGFDHTSAMREHSLVHANPNGTFSCPHCEKVFVEFLVLKKHVRGFHTNRTFPCEQCDKVFPRADKLRLHMLRHSTVRDFMCDTCGRQFKRKDKLKEHIKRMHSADREERDRMKALRPVSAKRFIPKVSPNEYHRFIYKCHLCLLGFKRRGMLVNHIAKRHPDLKPESVPELNLPILKTQRDYYCQYCDKVYKSSSKRKSHILKNHPGSELPQSARKKTNTDEIPGMPNPTYSQTVGSITTMPHQCEHCHKQYASKAKLLQHQRKHHPELLPHIPNMERIKRELPTVEAAQGFTIETVGETADNPADLLTQAMSELTQCVEYRQVSGQPGEQAYLARIGQGTPTMVQIQTPGGHGTQTIELAHLSQALQHFAPPQGHLPIQVQVSSGVTGQIQIPIATTQGGSSGSGTHILTVDQIPTADNTQAQQGVSTTQSQQLNFLPISIANGTYISKPWNNYQYKQH